MLLIRKLTLKCLRNNTRIFCRWVRGKSNQRADFLSRQKVNAFKLLVGKSVDPLPTPLPVELWPASKLWIE